MSYIPLYIAVLFAVMDWIAVARRWRILEYVCKPLTIALLLAWMWQASGFQGPLAWFGLGLLFSLVGDVVLLLPGDRLRPGFVAFLLAHIAYIVGFNTTPPPVNAASFIITVFVMITATQIYRRIARECAWRGQTGLKRLALVYSTVIGLMLLSALLTLVRSDWQPLPAWLVSAGAMSFFVSDTILGCDRFVAPITNASLRIMVSYHLGQILLAVGAVLQFSS